MSAAETSADRCEPDAAGAGHGRPCCGGGRHRRGGAGRGALAEPAVLAALIAGGGHGYDVRKTISELSGERLDIDQGGIYRVLRRLEDEGFISGTWVEGEAGPRKREYEVAPDAADLARDWIEHLRERERLAGLLAGLLEEALGSRDSPMAADEDTER